MWRGGKRAKDVRFTLSLIVKKDIAAAFKDEVGGAIMEGGGRDLRAKTKNIEDIVF